MSHPFDFMNSPPESSTSTPMADLWNDSTILPAAPTVRQVCIERSVMVCVYCV